MEVGHLPNSADSVPNANGNPQTVINVLDSSPSDNGVNQLQIFGTDQPDFFLFRANTLVSCTRKALSRNPI